jgi:hypothetical protein
MSERLIAAVYSLTKPIQPKFKTLSGDEAKKYAKEQARLWLINDNLTHGVTAWDFFKKNDLTGYRLSVNAVHIGVPSDHLLNNSRIETELKEMFHALDIFQLKLANHAPLDIDSGDKVRKILPEGFRQSMKKSQNQVAA